MTTPRSPNDQITACVIQDGVRFDLVTSPIEDMVQANLHLNPDHLPMVCLTAYTETTDRDDLEDTVTTPIPPHAIRLPRTPRPVPSITPPRLPHPVIAPQPLHPPMPRASRLGSHSHHASNLSNPPTLRWREVPLFAPWLFQVASVTPYAVQAAYLLDLMHQMGDDVREARSPTLEKSLAESGQSYVLQPAHMAVLDRTPAQFPIVMESYLRIARISRAIEPDIRTVLRSVSPTTLSFLSPDHWVALSTLREAESRLAVLDAVGRTSDTVSLGHTAPHRSR